MGDKDLYTQILGINPPWKCGEPSDENSDIPEEDYG